MLRRKRKSKVRYNVKRVSKDSKFGTIYLVYKYSQGRLRYSTGIVIDLRLWIPTPVYMVNENSVLLNRSRLVEYNEILRGLADKIIELIKLDPIKPIAEVKKELDSFLSIIEESDVSPPSFNEYIGLYRVKQKNKGVSEITLKKLDTLHLHLEGFNSRLLFSDINEDFKSKYIDYLKENTGVKSQNTLSKEFDLITQIMKYSIDDTYVNHLGHSKPLHDNRIGLSSKLSVMRVSTSKHPLNKLELDILYNFKGLSDSDQYVLDLFLIMCYSALRISDVLKGIKKVNLTSLNGKQYLQIHTYKGRNVKSDNLVTISYSGRLKILVEKYDFEWPSITGKTVNQRIKLIAKRANLDREVVVKSGEKGAPLENRPLWQTITNHIGRYTYISNALNDGANVKDLMKVTGQSMKILLNYDRSNPFKSVDRVEDSLSQ